MATIKIKNGSGAPAASDLVQGEPALDLTNKRLYTEDSGGNVIEIGTNPGVDVTFADNRKAVFGADSDLQLFHDGSNSYVQDAGDGALILNTTNGGGVYVYSAGETMATFNSNGAVNLYYDNAAKLATASTGIDVTGTVTADGLTVNSGSTNTVATFQSTDRTVVIPLIDSDGSTQIRSIDGEFAIRTGGDGGSSANTVERMRIDSSGNVGIGTSLPAFGAISTGIEVEGTTAGIRLQGATTGALELYHNNGLSTIDSRTATGGSKLAFNTENTERMRIDSSGNVLVGKTSSNYTIAGAELRDHGTVGGTTTTQTPFFANRTTDDGALFEFYRGTGTVGSIQTFGGNLQISPATTFGVDAPTDIFLDSAGVTTFKTNGTENARIDASGNLLVGTTETDIGFTASGDGCMLAPEGTLQLARDSANELLYLNKLGGNDGDIIRLSTDGNEIGVLGVRANYIKIGNGDTQLLFNSGSDAITPEGLTANRDAAIDLGRTVSRFKDLYLSGGVRGTSTIDITIPETSGGAINLEFGNNTNTTRRTVQAYKDNFEPAAADTGVISLGQAGNQWKNLYLSGGVVFGATSGNVSSKTLDDYEEGTFTGAVADASSGGNESSSALRGTYVKIGAVVYVQFNVSNISTTGMTAGNDVFITGLPFASKSVSGTAKYTGTANLSVVTFEQTPFMQLNEGQTYVKILEVRSGAGNDAVVVSQLSSGASDIHGNLVYETA